MKSLSLVMLVLCLWLCAASVGAQAEVDHEAESDESVVIEPQGSDPFVTPQQVEERMEALRRIGELGGESSLSTLQRVLRVDPVVEARVAAVEALAQIDSDAARRELLYLADQGWGYEISQRAAELALETAADGEERAHTIGELGTRAPVSSLTRMLRTDSDERVRFEALQTLNIHGHWSGFDEDLELIIAQDESEAVRDLALDIRASDRLERAGDALLLSGPLTFGVTYGINVLASLGSFLISLGNGVDATAQAGLRLLVPVAGPIWAANVGRYNDVVAFSVLAWVDAVLQLAGLTMTIAAVVIERRQRRRARRARENASIL